MGAGDSSRRAADHNDVTARGDGPPRRCIASVDGAACIANHADANAGAPARGDTA